VQLNESLKYGIELFSSVYSQAAKLSYIYTPITVCEKNEFSALKVGQEQKLDQCFLKPVGLQDTQNTKAVVVKQET